MDMLGNEESKLIRKQIQIGSSDFKSLIEDNTYYIDKTLFIRDVEENSNSYMLFTRPRRFGKSLNLSMLQYFYEKSEESNQHLFENFSIWEIEKYRNIQGTYPVIYLSFSSYSEDNWENGLQGFKIILSNLYKKHRYLIEALEEEDKHEFKLIISKKAHELEYKNCVLKLSEHLSNYHKRKVVILIDEYDTPIQRAWNSNYYNDSISFMKGFLTASLKDNKYVHKSVLTGILRVAKESIFSGLNNLDTYSIISNDSNSRKFLDKFGFTEEEISQLIEIYKPEHTEQEIRKWYNGYTFGNTTIYNPWSILKYFSTKELKPHWVNTSSNDLIIDLINNRLTENTEEKIQSLMEGQSIEQQISEFTVFSDIKSNNEIIWEFLLFSGYLTASKVDNRFRSDTYKLSIPNFEIREVFEFSVSKWLKGIDNKGKFQSLMHIFEKQDYDQFDEIFKEIVFSTISYWDVQGSESERIWHVFTLGLLSHLDKYFKIKSNRESGEGRPDILLLPIDIKRKGIIIELKKLEKNASIDKIEQYLDDALNQIENNKYKQDLVEAGVRESVNIAITFVGKEPYTKYKLIQN